MTVDMDAIRTMNWIIAHATEHNKIMEEMRKYDNAAVEIDTDEYIARIQDEISKYYDERRKS